MILRRLSQHVEDQNWFAVALDFIIVVIGVGVALMGQQWLIDRQQKADMVAAETVLRFDLFNNYFAAKERIAVADCRVEAFQAIGEKLLEGSEDWTGMPRILTNSLYRSALPTLLRSPSRNWGSPTWDAELSRGTFNQMDDVRRTAYDGIFLQAPEARQLQGEIFSLQGRLKVLALSTRLSQSDRLRYYDKLGELDEKSALLELMASQMIGLIEEVGIDFEPGEREELQMMLEASRESGVEVYGDCYGPLDWAIIDPSAEREAAP